MAGRKQHVIPQHFLRPFAEPGSKGQIWLYRKGLSEPKKISITDAAAQKHFYSKPSADGIPTLDDLITNYEHGLHRIVSQIRGLEVGETIPQKQISEVVTHLAVRSSYMRGLFEDISVSMSHAFDAAIRGEIIGQKMKLPMHCVPSAVEKLIIEECERQGLIELSPVDNGTVAKLAYFAAREGADELLSNAQTLIAQLTGEIAARSGQFSRNAQTSALSKSLAPQARQEELQALSWTIEPGPVEGAVLPDCTSIVDDGETWTSLILAEGGRIQSIVLPLEPGKLAVGRRHQSCGFNPSDFNHIATHAAHTFFLSSNRQKETDLDQLGGQVFTQVASMTRSAISEAVRDYVSDITKDTADIGDTANRSWLCEDDSNEHSFTVTLHDFGDEQFAKTISEELQSIMIAFNRHLPTSGLKGFVIANDFRSALNSVDRGFETKSDLSPIEDEHQIGVGRALSVLTEGKIRTVVVLRSSVAAGLLSENGERKEDALDVIIYMLASTALTTLIQNKFPNQILNKIDNEYERTLYAFTKGVFDCYFCASISCLSAHYLEPFEKVAESALVEMIEKIPNSRRDYQIHGDMDKLFPDSACFIGDFLSATARYLGCLRCQAKELDPDSSLSKCLDKHGLTNWIELFRKDLKAFDERLENWARFEEIFFVNRHFERLSAQLGLIPEPSSAGQIYVHVRV